MEFCDGLLCYKTGEQLTHVEVGEANKRNTAK